MTTKRSSEAEKRLAKVAFERFCAPHYYRAPWENQTIQYQMRWVGIIRAIQRAQRKAGKRRGT